MADSPFIALYLDLLKACLTGSLHEELYRPLAPARGGFKSAVKGALNGLLQSAAASLGLALVRLVNPTDRQAGEDWPAQAETMIGRERLNNLQQCIATVLAENVPGDLMECGVWRGGSTIFMRAMLKAYGDAARQVWVADSFQGLPPPDETSFKADAGATFHQYEQLAVSLEQVKANFARYGMLDERVRFLKGFFKDSLPTAPVAQLAVLRADGDMYESTIQILDALYPKLSVGGFCIVDDYGAVPACREATEDYRQRHGITEPIQVVDWTGIYWRREK